LASLNGTNFPFIHILPTSFIGEQKNTANLKNYLLGWFSYILKNLAIICN
jgi:hypothetical protein